MSRSVRGRSRFVEDSNADAWTNPNKSELFIKADQNCAKLQNKRQKVDKDFH